MKSKFAFIPLAALSANPSLGLVLAVVIGSICLNAGNTCRAQVLINGANTAGIAMANVTNSYTFTANTGDSINVRMGTSGFDGYLKLLGPTGASIGLSPSGTGSSTDDIVTNSAPTNGTYTVLVSDAVNGGPLTGVYVVVLAQIPESFVVPPGYAGGPLTNGANATGTITLGRQDLWTFTANAGDSINLRLGTTGFGGNLELYGPDGSLLKRVTGTDALLTETATTNGTYTVLVSSYDNGGNSTGTYVLNLSQIPEPFIVPAGDGGGPLINGANSTGTITLARQDLWSFTANTGDSINVRLGWTGVGQGYLELYGPDGALVKGTTGTDALIAETASTNGTFTVLVSGYDNGGTSTGPYVLNLSQIPEPFIVPAGYAGGSITNGASENGTITVARQDLWTFPANPGDTINLQLVWTGVGTGALELHGPNGASLKATTGTDAFLSETATNSGIFTVLVSGYDNGGTSSGPYVLDLSQAPGAAYRAWAQHYFACTNCSQASEFADRDGSGVDNYDEFASGFNPTNSAAFPHILSVAATNTSTDIRVTYLGANGDSTYTGGPASRTNVLEFTAGAADGSYSNNFVSTGHTNILSGGTGLGIVANIVDVGGATNLPARYYRVRVIAP